MEPRATRQTTSATEVTVRVSAVVVVGADVRTLELCLRAVLADPWVDELVVVDCAAPAQIAGALRALRADRRDVTLLRAPGVRAAEAWNLAAAHARGRFLLFVDPSVVLRRGASARLVSAGRRSPSPWIVGGRLLDAKGRERPSVRQRLPTALSAFFGDGAWSRCKRKGADAAVVSAVSDRMLLIPRADFEGLGGFDPAVAPHMEALDLCRRAVLAGGSVRFAPRAEAVQFASRGDPVARAADEARGLSTYLGACARSRADRWLAKIGAPALRRVAMVRAALTGGG